MAADRRRRGMRVALFAAAVIAAGALAVTASLTDRSDFCRSCHEMRPFYEGWQAGRHTTQTECVDCHVDAGPIARAAHKPVALKEVWSHLIGDTRFPRKEPPHIPSARCTRCHDGEMAPLPENPYRASAFSHALHVEKATCAECHPDVAHRVAYEALAAVDALSEEAASSEATWVGQYPRLRSGSTSPSVLAGHPDVACRRCHDMAAAMCGRCHAAPKGHFPADCTACHRAGRPFTQAEFAHTGRLACEQCHRPPAGHLSKDCARCHPPERAWANARYTHPPAGEHSASSFPCAYCHPKGLATATCVRCHPGGIPD